MSKKIGQYNLLKKISEGSFGRTFYAEHSLIGKPACIKQDKTGDPNHQKFFREEAQLLWDVNHVSLPTLKDYFETKDYGPVIVMSFVEGNNLEEIVVQKGAIDDEHILWITQRLLDALSYLHYKGVVHCDIKPQNIILHAKEHNAVLVDFGICTENPDQYTKAKGGTAFYIPPEFEKGLPPIPASDIYSLGKTIVYLAGGSPQTGNIPSDVHPELKSLISSMIRQDPMARPQDARTLNEQITDLRQSIYGRTATLEEFKFKHS